MATARNAGENQQANAIMPALQTPEPGRPVAKSPLLESFSQSDEAHVTALDQAVHTMLIAAHSSNQQHISNGRGQGRSSNGSNRRSSGSSKANSAEYEENNRTGHSSPATSNSCCDVDDVSILPDESVFHDRDITTSSPYIPLKQRPHFRSPSSVRALQMSSPPPFAHRIGTYISSPQYKHSLSSRNGTPLSVQSPKPTRLSAGKKKEYPLVLLHVTILPLDFPYSAEIMNSVVPGYVVENWNLLREKITDTVLSRGILLPHPKDDYELLEERLLESLELKTPRILACGHFHNPEHEEALDEEAHNTLCDNPDTDGDICDDCGRRVRNGLFGSGSGNKRWSIKIFAANGLMRAGAWTAAWNEMERVDVEIRPWIPEELRRRLESRQDEENELIEADQKRAQWEMGEHRRSFEEEKAIEQAEDKRRRNLENERRLKEIYGEEHTPRQINAPTPISDSVKEENQRLEPAPLDSGSFGDSRTRSKAKDTPFLSLLRIFFETIDKRNMAIFILGFLVIILSIRTSLPVQHSRVPSFEDIVGYTMPSEVTQPPKMASEHPYTLESDAMATPTLEATAAKDQWPAAGILADQPSIVMIEADPSQAIKKPDVPKDPILEIGEPHGIDSETGRQEGWQTEAEIVNSKIDDSHSLDSHAEADATSGPEISAPDILACKGDSLCQEEMLVSAS
ncbi:MAG: hypothetical protein M1829_001153 [Trizodia sp. TS-e1964]|nr:MAG: hypothetical protein M1829_001153 [Trizodia sp. TS-e1964]